MQKIYSIEEIKERVEVIAKKYNLKAVYLFGSYARGEATLESDVDLVVDTEGSEIHGIQIGGLYDDLSERLEKEVDMITERTLQQKDAIENSPLFIKNVEKERVMIYGKQ